MSKTPMDSGVKAVDQGHDALTFHAHGMDKIELPSSTFISDAHMTRDGDDLVLTAPNGEVAVIDGYFSADPAPLLTSPDGGVLTPGLVDSFSHGDQFASNATANDESPVGAVEEVKGTATVTRADGTIETIAIGTPIYQGDIVQTEGKGAVNITFVDQTTMAVSENARLAVDQYSYDPKTESGTTNFSVLRGLFVFTSGLIGRDDPDDVKIDTPVGSIGIRGTIIAGEINPHGDSKISVLEGAIVVTNGQGDTTLSHAFETVKISGFDKPMVEMGVIPAHDITTRFSSVSAVAPTLFTSINDSAHEQKSADPAHNDAPVHNDAQPANDKPAGEPQSQNNTQTAPVADSVAQTAAPQPVAPAPAPVDSGMATMTGTASGLPTMNTAMGQTNSIPSSSDSSGLPSTAAAVSPSITNSPSSTAQAPVNTTTTANTASTTTAGTTTAPTITQQAPPSVINANANNGSASGSTGTTTPPTPTLNATFAIKDTDVAGTVVGHVTASVAGVIAFTTTSANFVINTNGDVSLSSQGANVLHSSLDVVQLGNLDVTATYSATGPVSNTFTPIVQDAGTVIDLTQPHTGVSVISDSINNNFGYSISALGDVNHDGFADFVVSNNTTDPAQNHSYVVYGVNGALPLSTDVPTLVSGFYIRLADNHTPVVNTEGTIVAGIGNFNNDGSHTPDYAVAQSGNNGGASGSGYVTIINGDTSAANFYTYTIATPGAGVGSSIAGVGDYNNDGYTDMAVGASSLDKVYLIHGGPLAYGTLPAALEIIGGIGTGSGSAVSGIGDFNGDGYSDLAIGAPGSGGLNQGRVDFWMGDKTGGFALTHFDGPAANTGFGSEISGLGDINGDGYSDVLVASDSNYGAIYFGGASAPTSAAATFNVPSGYRVTGGGGVGDFNGDGYDDFSVSLSDTTGTHAYVVFGSSTIGVPIDLNYLKDPNHALDFKYSSTDSDDLEIKSVGDINGDGYDDFAMGVPDANGAAAGNGGLVIVYGHGTGNTSVSNNGAAIATGDHLVGTSGHDNFQMGTFDGISARGGAGDDNFNLSNMNFLSIDGGTGNDSLDVFGDQNFSTLNYEKISGIEVMTFTNNAQTMTLSLENIFNLLKTSDTGKLTIDSTHTGDVLNLAGTGTNATSASSTAISAGLHQLSEGTVAPTNAGGYNQFSIGGYTLYIDQDVQVNLQT